MIQESPYKGLVPFSAQDSRFFFGRARERQVIAANLSAYRLTVLYGASGVGKTSLLQAGVIHDLSLRSKLDGASTGTPEFVPVALSSWKGDPAENLKAEIKDAVAGVPGAETLEAASNEGLASTLQRWAAQLDTDFLVVLDQFEEFFVYRPEATGDSPFAADLVELVNEPQARVHLLISIRDDALALLDRFKGHIPTLFDNYLRVGPLGRDGAQNAIQGPLEEYNRELGSKPGVSIEPELVTSVLAGVEAGRAAATSGANGMPAGVASESDGDQIDAAYLQLVMSRLWAEEIGGGSGRLTKKALERMGGTKQIVRGHVDEVMHLLDRSEQRLAAEVFRHLVTRSGSKIAHSAPDLGELTESPPDRVKAVLDRLSSADTRILRPVSSRADPTAPSSYEIRHDRLAPAILDWRRRYDEAQARRRIYRRGLAALLVLCVAVIGLLIFARTLQDQRDALQRQLFISNIALTLAKSEDTRTRISSVAEQLQACANRAPRDPCNPAGFPAINGLDKTSAGALLAETAQVIEERKQIAGEVRKTDPPNTASADVRRKLIAAIPASIAADRAYQSCIADVGLPTKLAPCLAAALRASNHTSNVKERFNRAWDALLLQEGKGKGYLGHIPF